MPFTYSEEDVIPHPFWRNCLFTTTHLSEERGKTSLIGWVPWLTRRLTLTLAVKTTHITLLSLTKPKKDKKQFQAFH